MMWPFRSKSRQNSKEQRAATRRTRRSLRFTPSFEPLEDRQFLTASATSALLACEACCPVPPPCHAPSITISTTQSPASAIVGSAIADRATVSGGTNLTGTVTFKLFNNPNGTGTPLFTSTETLVGGTATSQSTIVTATGTDYWVATFTGTGCYCGKSATSGTASEPVTITPATPTIATTQQPLIATLGSSIADKATVSGGYHPTGTVTFNLYNNATGTGTPLFTDTETLSAGTATSKSYATAAAGTDYWVVTYNGNASNKAVTSGVTSEPVTITPATPAISTTQAQISALVGTSISDTAIVTGGHSPTGTVTFNVYNNPSGAGTPLFTDTETLVGGAVASKSYTTAAMGTDYWVATYNGNANNKSVSSSVTSEPVAIKPATPTIITSQTPSLAAVGTAVHDTATVSGGFNPTGTVTFNLYNNSNGTGTPLFTDTETLSGGAATSKSYTTAAPGTDYWVATYSGDSNNASVTSGVTSEPVFITQAAPTITTSQQPASAVAGTAIADKATVSGGFNPTGTVTFNLYSNPTGTGTPLFTDTETLSAGTATSKSYTAAAGTDYWVVTYSGDSNNIAVTSGLTSEPVTITPATPTISTTAQPTSISFGNSIADKATVSGGFNPTGTVTFNLYSNSTGTGTPLFTDTETLSGGTATSKSYTPTVFGTVYWVATYSGDTSNVTVSSGTSSEPVTITGETE